MHSSSHWRQAGNKGRSLEPPPRLAGEAMARATGRTLADLDGDVLGHCAGFLGDRDVASLAMACRPLRDAAYCDSVWGRLFRARWPHQLVPAGVLGLRELYVRRHTEINQMKFSDPLVTVYSSNAAELTLSHLMLKKDDVWFAQGSVARRLKLDSSLSETVETFLSHGARITCMRLFPIAETSLLRSDSQANENVLVTSSADRTIRLWWKGRSQRCLRGHLGPVTTLSDKLLGDGGFKVLASGGEDCTVRLWSVSSSRKNHCLLSTCHGHEKALSFLSVAWHKPSLLVSCSKDSKVRVWDTAAPPSSGSSSCVGKTYLGPHGSPIAVKCYDSLCYIAAGSQVTAIDLRTMKKAFSFALRNQKILSCGMLPSKWLICTGVDDKALLWDIRKSHEPPNVVAKLDSDGPVTLLHLDPYKIVTAGPSSDRVNVWETGTCLLANSLSCRDFGEDGSAVQAMSVDGCRIVTAGSAIDGADLFYRDFSNCSVPVSLSGGESDSRFWGTQHVDDDD